MEIRGLAFLPCLWVVWTLLGICALFALTSIQGHKKYPYISDMGIHFPELIVYVVIFVVSSIIGSAIAYIQYRFMILRSDPSEKCFIIGQRILLIMGWIVCIGSTLNAFFSVKTNPTIHRVGAGLAFILNTIYNLCQSICLYKKSYSSLRMCHIRLATSLLTIVVLLIFAVGMVGFFFNLCSGRCLENLDMAGMVTEWVGSFFLTAYQLTNFMDFQHLSLTFSRKGMTIHL